ncbi:lysophospholipid acyltransferase family protein [Desulfurivibrio alkaliphilus]|uniref:1-acyl-sn-glycerol-3-phosphate acyltransferase n=1 Tax=Desulfurivibrio alkaliphilus (strain DSM 19089 / UNIQEM U267 / AHT2) TaxID=589865 RepID=D6Z6Q3_DESAT|nr:lysophospholipid acyltransferase family protein [Desulfurivibrio alkaliphilus]ADH85012.1 1-acyl-sn-glycerol-3-phosphate acyltransferase [Desulfurivibrio alkaliphilus AHT 2]
MKQISAVFNFFRGLMALLAIPLFTGLVSFAALPLAIFLGYRGEQLQFLARWWGRAICRVSGVKVEVAGLQHLDPGRTYIFAANHQSQFDIFVLQGFLAFDFRWLAKKELFQIPLFGWAMRRAGYIPVDRSHGRRAMVSLNEAAKEIAAGTSVIIFPEGTRSPDGRLQPFKAGAMVLAIKSEVEIVPLAIVGTHEILPKGKLLPKPGRVLIRLGEPVKAADYTVKDKQALAAKLENQVRSLM